MKIKIPISTRISDSDLAKIKSENTKKVIDLIKKGKTVEDLCSFPYRYPKKFVDEVIKFNKQNVL